MKVHMGTATELQRYSVSKQDLNRQSVFVSVIGDNLIFFVFFILTQLLSTVDDFIKYITQVQ